jgi:hypothetical protein
MLPRGGMINGHFKVASSPVGMDIDGSGSSLPKEVKITI